MENYYFQLWQLVYNKASLLIRIRFQGYLYESGVDIFVWRVTWNCRTQIWPWTCIRSWVLWKELRMIGWLISCLLSTQEMSPNSGILELFHKLFLFHKDNLGQRVPTAPLAVGYRVNFALFVWWWFLNIKCQSCFSWPTTKTLLTLLILKQSHYKKIPNNMAWFLYINKLINNSDFTFKDIYSDCVWSWLSRF